MRRTFSVVFAILVAISASVSAQVASGVSATCGPVAGTTARDRDNAIAFCTRAVPKDLNVQGAIAMDSLLWVQVSRPLANIMLEDRLNTEQVVKGWMHVWKALSGSPAVTIYVEWQDVEVAKGETTLLDGDVVSVRQ